MFTVRASAMQDQFDAERKTVNGTLFLIQSDKQVEWKGLSGSIQFEEGRRIQFKLDLVKLKQQSLVKVGEWTPHVGLNITDRSILFDAERMNVTLVVITILVGGSVGGLGMHSFGNETEK